MTPGIEFEGVWKKFRIGERHDSLRDLIPAAARRLTSGRRPDSELGQREFWALQDASFSVRPGEAVGIIGPNGAGKSTTLKILTRLLRATKGACVVRGRVGALIEVAAGFHPDLTGRENVFLQGAIMGMRQAEIRRRFDAIVEFAGVSEFIDSPVKRYSSGMNARLGFAIAAHLDPDVMIIDEVLSVGDSRFQSKCVAHLRRMVERGTPIVFVSHNLPAVLELCTRVVVINKGTVQFDGNPAEGVQRYQSAAFASTPRDRRPDQPIHISRVDLFDETGSTFGVFREGARVSMRIAAEAREPVEDPRFRVQIHSAEGVLCFSTGTDGQLRLGTVSGSYALEFQLPRLTLLPGCYTFSVSIARHDGVSYDAHERAYPFSVESDSRDSGIVALDHEWTVQG